ncbi:MAG: NADPH-dependent oxidoreductase [Rhizobiales bacterium NRL2]|jgi:nitroreductase/FMN reductase [NAD(P)H]|nr:MAG: NADPH-dependent oxidoreductase [Rhizobiales bacterium NRL2]
MTDSITDLLERRFGDAPQPHDADEPQLWRDMASRGSCRRFSPEPLPPALVERLAALALCSPTKSDLQQRDILIVDDPALRREIDALLTEGAQGQRWISRAPHMLVVLGNNRRQRRIHEWRNRTFANDHLDAFFNAAVDAGIALSALVLAAEAAGVGACPISAIRNHAQRISELLALPAHVFPVAGVALGWPDAPTPVVPRLPLSHTVHRDRYREAGLREAVDAYDARRRAIAPYRVQRDVARFGEDPAYGWSEDKARQYATPERADFGAYVRAIGFSLD